VSATSADALPPEAPGPALVVTVRRRGDSSVAEAA
jgi:hypothetical protein